MLSQGQRTGQALTACLITSLTLVACEPKLVVGKWTCEELVGGAGGEGGGSAACAPTPVVDPSSCEEQVGGAGGQSASSSLVEPVVTPWSTGFENGFCDYGPVGGYCYADPRASFEIVTYPVHSGKFAAAFNISTSAAFDGLQARCVRQGELPQAAYYSAFIFIPSVPSSAQNWNLFHFRAADAPQHGLWDVSLVRNVDGTLHVTVYDFLRPESLATSGVPAVPVGEWFQLEVYWKRAADATGEFTVYQDGAPALQLQDRITDDSSHGQWYVGNLAISLTPADSTLYVDDVSIREAP